VNFRNKTNDVICIYDLFDKELKTPIRFKPGEILDLYRMCGFAAVGRSEQLRQLIKEGSIVLTTSPQSRPQVEEVRKRFKTFTFSTPLLSAISKDSKELPDSFREAVEDDPFGFELEISGGKARFLCKRCQEELVFAKYAFCPSCSTQWSFLMLIDRLDRTLESLNSLRGRLYSLESKGSFKKESLQ